MKKKITIQQKLMKNYVIFIIITLALSCPSAFGYGLDSHYVITKKAVDESSLEDAVKQIGFTKLEDEIKGSLDTKSIVEWIAWGSKWEDLIAVWAYGLMGNER